jgi:hypothetical protein
VDASGHKHSHPGRSGRHRHSLYDKDSSKLAIEVVGVEAVDADPRRVDPLRS